MFVNKSLQGNRMIIAQIRKPKDHLLNDLINAYMA